MGVLLNLCISCITEENYWAEFNIGLFRSMKEIDAVLKKLKSDEVRFSKLDCKVKISEVEIVGDYDKIECVYRFYGQNIDSSFEGEIIESPCYIDKSTAIQELTKAKKYTPRQEWHLETYIVGKSNLG